MQAISARLLPYRGQACVVTPADPKHVQSDLYINPRLNRGWLNVQPASEPSSSPFAPVLIGYAQGRALYTSNPEAFNQFVIFVLEATASGSTAGASGKAGADGPKVLFALPSGPVPQL